MGMGTGVKYTITSQPESRPGGRTDPLIGSGRRYPVSFPILEPAVTVVGSCDIAFRDLAP